MAAIQPQPQERVIDPFRNEGGEGWLRDRGRDGDLVYTGETKDGRAEGRGAIRLKGGGVGVKWTIRGASFRGGAMLPCRAVFACDDGDAFAGPLAASGEPADGARGAVVRGADGGRFEGTWPARGADNSWFQPLRGAAWVRADGSVHAVALDGRTAIFSGVYGWRPGGAGWERVGVLKGRAGQVRAPPPAPAPRARAHARTRARAAAELRAGRPAAPLPRTCRRCPTVSDRFRPFATDQTLSNRPHLIQPQSGADWLRSAPLRRPGRGPGPARLSFPEVRGCGLLPAAALLRSGRIGRAAVGSAGARRPPHPPCRGGGGGFGRARPPLPHQQG
jgi:hypothetical protein